MSPTPEIHYIPHPTPYVPNSPLPVLIYRSCLSSPTASSICETIEANNWLKGGIFKHYPFHHFHSLTHECYAIFKAESTLLLGKGPLDAREREIEEGEGEAEGKGDGEKKGKDLIVNLGVGDVIILPAGVAHASLRSSEDYEYVGLYPKGSPPYDNNFCRASPTETSEKTVNARAVPIPDTDPLFGEEGPLVGIWREALRGRDRGVYG